MNKKPQSYGAMASTSDVDFPNNSSAEINNLCDNIVTNIYTINQSWKTLDTCFKHLGTNRDNQGLRDKIHVTHISTNEIITATTRNIHKVTRAVKKCEKQQKLQVEKLTENFKEAIARYSALQKQAADKMKSTLLEIATIETEDPDLQENLQKQATVTRELAFEQEMLLDREAQIRQIETDIIDVNQIMRELSALVNEQSETIDNVENAVEHTAGNLEEGTDHLIKASGYLNRHRRRLCYLVIIAFIVAIILVVILVTQLKR